MRKIYNTHFKYYNKDRYILSFNNNKEKVRKSYVKSESFRRSALALIVVEQNNFLYNDSIIYTLKDIEEFRSYNCELLLPRYAH